MGRYKFCGTGGTTEKSRIKYRANVRKVGIEVGLDKKIRLFGSHPFFQPNLYWEHALALITLDANDSLPMSKKDWGNPKYKDAQFGITTTEEETTMSKEKVRKNRERSKIMSLLFDEGKGQYEKAARIPLS